MNKRIKHFLLLLGLLAVLSLCLAGVAFATGDTEEEDRSDWTIDDYRNQLKEIDSNLSSLQEAIDDQTVTIDGLKVDLADLDAQMIVVNQELQLTQEQIDLTQEAIDKLEEEIDEVQAELDARMAILEERLRDVYIYGDLSLLDVVLESSSFQDFVTLFDLVEMLVANDKALAAEIQAKREQLEADQAELEQSKAELEAVRAEQKSQMADLEELEAQKQAALEAAEEDRAMSQAMYDSEMAAAEDARNTIRELQAASDPTLSYGGYMIWPLPAPFDSSYITSPYGWRVHPVYGTNRFHSGIDIGANGGTPIYAAADGQIILAQYYGGYGNCIMINHGSGIVSLYGHMSAYGSYGYGDYVTTGDVIGYVGTTGTSTGNHLHFECRYYGDYTSPWNYL